MKAAGESCAVRNFGFFFDYEIAFLVDSEAKIGVVNTLENGTMPPPPVPHPPSGRIIVRDISLPLSGNAI